MGGKVLTPTSKEPETKQISTAAFLALQYGALTIEELVTHWTEYSVQQIHDHLEKAYKKQKDAGTL